MNTESFAKLDALIKQLEDVIWLSSGDIPVTLKAEMISKIREFASIARISYDKKNETKKPFGYVH